MFRGIKYCLGVKGVDALKDGRDKVREHFLYSQPERDDPDLAGHLEGESRRAETWGDGKDMGMTQKDRVAVEIHSAKGDPRPHPLFPRWCGGEAPKEAPSVVGCVQVDRAIKSDIQCMAVL